MRISPLKNFYIQTSFTSKSKQMRDLDDINRATKAEFEGIPSSSYYKMKLRDVYNNSRMSDDKKYSFQRTTDDLLFRTLLMRQELEGADTLEDIMKIVQKYKVANCGELCLYLQKKLNSLGYEAKRMCFEIRRAPTVPKQMYERDITDHAFILLNEKEDADWQEPVTWGTNAIILDPWTGIADYKDQALDKIKNYFKVNPKREYLLFDRCYSDIENE